MLLNLKKQHPDLEQYQLQKNQTVSLKVPPISNVAGTVRPTLGLDMIRVAFQNSIATRTGINGVEEIIIQTKAIGNASIPTDENGRVWIYYGKLIHRI